MLRDLLWGEFSRRDDALGNQTDRGVGGHETRLWSLILYVETDDDDVVERLRDAVSRAACPVEDTSLEPDHACPIPWFLITSHLSTDDDEATTIRGLLNR